MRRNYCWIILLLLISSLFLIRVYDLSGQSIWIDESYTIEAAKNIGEYGHPVLGSGRDYHRELPNSYALFLSGSVFGFNEFGMRLPAVMFSLATLVIIFLYCRRLFDGDVVKALIPVVLIGFSTIHIAWARQARMYTLLQMLFFLSLYLFDLYLEKKDKKALLLFSVSVLLAILTHKIALIIVPIIILQFLLFRYKDMWQMPEKLRIMFRENKMYLIGLSSVFLLIFHYLYSSLPSLQQKMDYFRPYKFFFIYELFVFTYLAILGFFLMKDARKSIPLALGVLITMVIFSFYIDVFARRYLFIIVPLLFIFSAEAIMFIPKMFKHRSVQILLFLIIMSAVMWKGFTIAPQTNYWLEKDVPQPDFKVAYNSFEISDNDTLLVTNPLVSKFYGNKGDYWVAFDYSNKGNITRILTKESGRTKEVYDNVSAIKSHEEFMDIINSTRGYVVIDIMAKQRMNRRIVKEIEKMDIVFHKNEKEHYGEIWVYRYNDSLHS